MTTTANYITSESAAIVLLYGDANQSVVAGVNKLKLPGYMRNSVEVIEFRKDFDVSFATGGKLTNITASGNYVTGDTYGQDQLKTYLKNNTKINDVRFYMNLTDFVTCDLANDANSSFQVLKYEPGEADKNGVVPFSTEFVPNGEVATFVAHITDGATPTMTFPVGGLTITDSGSGFVTAGFKAGQTLIIEGSTSNDGQYLITAVAAGTITCAAATFTVEACIEGTALHGGSL